jgi:hypothetical protein
VFNFQKQWVRSATVAFWNRGEEEEMRKTSKGGQH